MPDNPRMGSYEYYERLYEVEERHWWSRGIRDVAARILNAHYRGMTGLNILDAGCGTGITLSWLEQNDLPKRVIGLDLSWYALEFCRRRGNHLLCQSSVLGLPFKSDSFDLVVCNDVIQHLPGKEGDQMALREFYRVLKLGGCLFVRTNSNWGMGNQRSGHDDYKRYSLDQLRHKIRQSGFRMLKATHANILLSVIPTIKRYLKQRKEHLYYKQGLPIRLLPPHLEWLNILLYWVMKGEAWFLSKPSITSPFGHTIFFLAQKPEPGYRGR